MRQGTGQVTPVRFGVDLLLEDSARIAGAARIGLLTNGAARLAAVPSVFSRSALQRAGVPLVMLFSPEHGIGATAVDGAFVPDVTDPATGLPVVSLYGERFAPPAPLLRDLDLVLVDLPDVGARFYTYPWTMTQVIDACAATGTPIVVLDRPNPLGGLLRDAEGPLLDDACMSLLGRLSIPVRHSLTIGELARLWQRERTPRVELDVVACTGWTREMQWPDTGLTWVPTSPAMTSFESALLYPGTCLFEATNVSVGRGTNAPFQRLSAPWLEAAEVARRVAADERSGGVIAFGAGTTVELRVINRRTVRPVALGLSLLETIHDAHPETFAWTTYPTAANSTGERHLDRLVGRANIGERISRGVPVRDDLLEITGWKERIEPIQLYA